MSERVTSCEVVTEGNQRSRSLSPSQSGPPLAIERTTDTASVAPAARCSPDGDHHKLTHGDESPDACNGNQEAVDTTMSCDGDRELEEKEQDGTYTRSRPDRATRLADSGVEFHHLREPQSSKPRQLWGDPGAALRMFERAAKLGHPGAMEEIHRLRLRERVEAVARATPNVRGRARERSNLVVEAKYFTET